MQYLTLNEVAARTGYPRSTVFHWLRTGWLPSARFGRAYAIAPADIEKIQRPPKGRKPGGKNSRK
jgi:excisionase family DNA binding protein